jgi:hypothetical protein
MPFPILGEREEATVGVLIDGFKPNLLWQRYKVFLLKKTYIAHGVFHSQNTVI